MASKVKPTDVTGRAREEALKANADAVAYEADNAYDALKALFAKAEEVAYEALKAYDAELAFAAFVANEALVAVDAFKA